MLFYVRQQYFFVSQLAIIVLLMCSSCATVFLPDTVSLHIQTQDSSVLICNGKNYNQRDKNHTISVKKQDKPLIIKAYNDSLEGAVRIDPRLHPLFWADAVGSILFVYPVIIDLASQKAYTYSPNYITIPLDKKRDTITDIFSITMNKKNMPEYNFETDAVKQKFNNYKHQFKITPFKIIGTYNPSIELSYQKKHRKQGAYQVSLAYLLSPYFLTDSSVAPKNVKGVRSSIERKFFINTYKDDNIFLYISSELSYLYSQFKSKYPYYIDSADFKDYGYYNEKVKTERHTLGLSIKFGFEFVYKKMVVDFYIGGGARFNHVVYKNKREWTTPFVKREVKKDYLAHTPEEGNNINLILPLNFKVGYCF